jgi:hypothetical protein
VLGSLPTTAGPLRRIRPPRPSGTLTPPGKYPPGHPAPEPRFRSRHEAVTAGRLPDRVSDIGVLTVISPV